MAQPTCTIPGCDRPYRARGWCATHYARWAKGRDPLAEPVRWKGISCSEDGCERPVKGRGKCSLHWQRDRRLRINGVPKKCQSWLTVEERLRHVGWAERLRVPELGPCWEWNGYIRAGSHGYGVLIIEGESDTRVHRHAYRVWVDPDLKKTEVIRHRCDNPPCMRPDHLVSGTKKQNTQDAVLRGRISRGARHNGAKILSDDAIRKIRTRYAAGGIYQRELAAEHGVSTSQISRIIRGDRWKHVK